MATDQTTTATERRTIRGLDELRALEGEEIGASDWVTVDQPLIDCFASVTGDEQWIHVDVERCEQASPFGTTVAHGYLVLALGPRLAYRLAQIEGVQMSVNYGLDRLRFISPVPAGSRLRLRSTLTGIEDRGAGVLARFRWTFELEGQEKAAAIADHLAMFYFA